MSKPNGHYPENEPDEMEYPTAYRKPNRKRVKRRIYGKPNKDGRKG